MYESIDDGGLISNDGPTIIYLIFKTIKPDKCIGVSNLKYEIDKATLDKFLNNVKELIYEISSNYSIVIDNGWIREGYVTHL